MKSILKKSAVLVILSLIFLSLIVPVFAHPGSLDENGGHWNHKTGEYHYHEGIHTEGSNSSNSTTRYYYDFEEFEDYTTSNSNNSVNSAIKEETTTSHIQNKTKTSIGEIVLYVLLALFFGIPVCWFAYMYVFGPFIVAIYEFIKLIKENIELRDKLLKYKKVKYNIFPFKKQNVFLTEEWFQIERENIIKELMSFDCLKLKETFPEDVLLQKTFDLGFKNTGFYSPYSRYTIYRAYKSNELHKTHNCGISMLYKGLSLDYDADSTYYILCKNCWKSTDMKDYPDLFMPEWYRQYKEVKNKMDKYHITAADIKQRKQEEIASLLKNSAFNIWEQEIHSKIEQIKRIKRSSAVIIISYDKTSVQAIIKGSQNNTYTTTFSECTCSDFSIHHLPCKHMYKLAAEHGGIDFTKYV